MEYIAETEKAVKLRLFVEDYDLEYYKARDVWVPKSQLTTDGIPSLWITRQKALEFYGFDRAASQYEATWIDASGHQFEAAMSEREIKIQEERQARFEAGVKSYEALIEQARSLGVKGVRTGCAGKRLRRRFGRRKELLQMSKRKKKNLAPARPELPTLYLWEEITLDTLEQLVPEIKTLPDLRFGWRHDLDYALLYTDDDIHAGRSQADVAQKYICLSSWNGELWKDNWYCDEDGFWDYPPERVNDDFRPYTVFDFILDKYNLFPLDKELNDWFAPETFPPRVADIGCQTSSHWVA